MYVRPLSMKYQLFLPNYVLWGLPERCQRGRGSGPGVGGLQAGHGVANPSMRDQDASWWFHPTSRAHFILPMNMIRRLIPEKIFSRVACTTEYLTRIQLSSLLFSTCYFFTSLYDNTNPHPRPTSLSHSQYTHSRIEIEHTSGTDRSLD